MAEGRRRVGKWGSGGQKRTKGEDGRGGGMIGK